MNCVQAAIPDYSQNDNAMPSRAEINFAIDKIGKLYGLHPSTVAGIKDAIHTRRLVHPMTLEEVATEAVNMADRICRLPPLGPPTDEQVAAYNALQAALWAKRRGEVA